MYIISYFFWLSCVIINLRINYYQLKYIFWFVRLSFPLSIWLPVYSSLCLSVCYYIFFSCLFVFVYNFSVCLSTWYFSFMCPLSFCLNIYEKSKDWYIFALLLFSWLFLLLSVCSVFLSDITCTREISIRGKVQYCLCSCQSALSLATEKEENNNCIFQNNFFKADWQLHK